MVLLRDQDGTIARLILLRTCIVVIRPERKINADPDSLARLNQANPYTILGKALIRAGRRRAMLGAAASF
jgi:hypothetical protein